MFLLYWSWWLLGSDTPPALSELVAQARPSVVHLKEVDSSGNPSANGTGFFVHEEGVIATNHHVVAGRRNLSAVLADGKELDVLGVLASDEAHDVALLKVGGSDYPVLPLGDFSPLEQGDKVFVIGSPYGLSGTVTEGIVSAIRLDGMTDMRANTQIEGPLLQITAPMSPGSSGSPVLNSRGEVVGVAVAIVLGGQNLNFAVPATFVRLLQEHVDPEATPAPLQSLPVRNLIISAVAFAMLGLLLAVSGRKRRTAQRVD